MTGALGVAAFPEVLGEALQERGLSVAEVARRSGIAVDKLQSLADGAAVPTRALMEMIAKAIGMPPAKFLEYRVDCVIGWLGRSPSSVDQLFVESLSPVEQRSVDVAGFDSRSLRVVLAAHRVEYGMTQTELADEMGITPGALTQAVSGRGQLSIEFVEMVAGTLGVAPESLLAYRLEVVREWLLDHPSRTDAIFVEGLSGIELAPYRAWPVRSLPDPLEADASILVRTFIEIVATEGPVIGARVYEIWFEAAGGLPETKARRSKLNRVSAAAVQAGYLVAENEFDEPGQMRLTLRANGTPRVVVRARGGRRVSHIPLSELAEVVRRTSAWRRNASTAAIQRELAEIYGLQKLYSSEVEYLNWSINRAGDGT